jgi:hypothetical protein
MPCPQHCPTVHHNQTGITVVGGKDLRQTVAITTAYGETNAWLEWIKYAVCTLHRSDCYTRVTGRPEP